MKSEYRQTEDQQNGKEVIRLTTKRQAVFDASLH